MEKINLCGEWKLVDLESDKTYNALVPESNYSALIRQGVIEDPFVGMVEHDVLWVAKRDWAYIRTIDITNEVLVSDKVLLVADMLDTLAEVYINDQLVKTTQNVHIQYKIDIKSFLKEGENEIKIIFRSPMEYITEKQKYDKAPNASMGVDGVPHIRKTQCHFGWDWGPILPPSGIMGDIAIESYSDCYISGFDVEQLHADGKVIITVRSDVEMLNDNTGDVAIETIVITPGGDELTATEGKAVIEKPMLWNTHDVTGVKSQPLYKVIVRAVKDGNVLSEVKKQIGLRVVNLNRSADKFGKNFMFEVNGNAIFAKGANWIPADSFIDRVDRDKMRELIKSCQDAGMNMIRVWGGGYYESEDFYDMCDEYGILVWQDFAFACAPYPFYNEEFLENVKEEVTFNVNRLKHRASLGIWCGNNEIEMMTIGWQLRAQYVKYTEIFFHNILAEMVETLDGVTPFIPGSPTSSDGFLKKVNCDEDGDTHLWHVWHGLQPLNYYRKRFTRFCSEFGLESLPDMKTVEFFAKPEDYDLTSPVFMSHQKCDSGNSKMIFYASTRFPIPKKFDDIVYMTQVIQMICVEDATEHWRRHRGRCNGSLYWQLNDCWPVSSWAGMDYFGRKKALQYRAAHFNAPITVSVLDKKTTAEFFVINDTDKDEEVTFKYSLVDFKGKVLDEYSEKTVAKKCSSFSIKTVNFKTLLKKAKYNAVLVSEVIDASGSVVAQKTTLFKPEKDLKLPVSEIQKTVTVKDDVATISLKTDGFQRFVWVMGDKEYLPVSDNCFDLLPNASKVITAPANGRTAEEIEKDIIIKTVSTVEPKGSRTSDFWTRLKIRLVPINVANWFYYHTV